MRNPSEVIAPCPFCGGEAEATNYVVEGAVRCLACGATIAREHGPRDDTGYPAAIAAWNRRPASTPASGEVVAWPSGVLNKADTLDILTRHNAWRRGAKTNQTDPRMLGLALDAVIAALQEANHAG